ncbi:MAG: DUF1638 domain-containing protein [Planctomycetota bacterium]
MTEWDFNRWQTGPRVACIACEVVCRELYHLAARSDNVVDFTMLSQGLHDIGCQKMSARLQQEIDAIDADRYDTVVLAYALCNNGIVGLTAPPGVTLVIPRAHDCISFLLGSKEAYRRWFDENPDTYVLSVGWMERDLETREDVGSDDTFKQLGMGLSYREYADKYGEDNAQYLVETLGNGLKNYSGIAYVDMPFLGTLNDRLAEQARVRAEEKGFGFRRIEGDLSLLEALLEGPWDDQRFLVLQPGQSVRACHDESIICTE